MNNPWTTIVAYKAGKAMRDAVKGEKDAPLDDDDLKLARNVLILVGLLFLFGTVAFVIIRYIL